MRIEAFDAAAFGEQNDWVCDTMTPEDAASHLMGLAEIDVVEDVIAKKTPLQEARSGKIEYWVQRRIRGYVTQRLRLWGMKSSEFGASPILGGISLPEEKKVYETGQVIVSYDASENLLEIVAADTIME